MDDGVYVSADQGNSWSRFGVGLPNVQVRQLELNADLQILAAGTHGRGMWQILVPPPDGSPGTVRIAVLRGNLAPSLPRLSGLDVPLGAGGTNSAPIALDNQRFEAATAATGAWPVREHDGFDHTTVSRMSGPLILDDVFSPERWTVDLGPLAPAI
jgi:hypothetical protein